MQLACVCLPLLHERFFAQVQCGGGGKLERAGSYDLDEEVNGFLRVPVFGDESKDWVGGRVVELRVSVEGSVGDQLAAVQAAGHRAGQHGRLAALEVGVAFALDPVREALFGPGGSQAVP